MCLRALLDLPTSEGATLLGVPRLLEDEDYRKRVLRFVLDSECRAFFEGFERKGERYRAEVADPVLSRVGTLLQSPDLQRVFGQVKRKVEPRAVMDRRKIFIANLRKGKLGREEANLIGSFIVTDFVSAAYAREDILEQGLVPVPFYLYVDEFQNFTTRSFADALSEARKYGLAFTLAQQFRAQMSDEVKSALVGNVGSVVAFRVGEEDAPDLAQQFAPFSETTLLELGPYLRVERCTVIRPSAAA